MEQENPAPAAAKKKNTGLIIGLCGVVVAAIIAVVAIIIIMANGADPVIGKYNIYAYVDKDGKESTQEIALVKAFGANITIEFKKDNTGEIVTDYSGSSFLNSEENSEAETKQSQAFNWKDGKITGLQKEGDKDATESGEYKLSDDKKYVIISTEGEEKSIKFERIEEEKK
jgi:flagellar basal body-associated protein FliL